LLQRPWFQQLWLEQLSLRQSCFRSASLLHSPRRRARPVSASQTAALPASESRAAPGQFAAALRTCRRSGWFPGSNSRSADNAQFSLNTSLRHLGSHMQRSSTRGTCNMTAQPGSQPETKPPHHEIVWGRMCGDRHSCEPALSEAEGSGERSSPSLPPAPQHPQKASQSSLGLTTGKSPSHNTGPSVYPTPASSNPRSNPPLPH
jgi:hypothetical protein